MKSWIKILTVLFAAVFSIFAFAVDVDVVTNTPMTAVSGAAGWYQYKVDALEEGSTYNIMFNNGGWSGGKTTEHSVESSSAKMCFTSKGTGSAVTEISCPTTEAEEAALTEGDLALYSSDGCIYGNVIGAVAIYSASGACMQVIDADGAFHSRTLTSGIYIVKSGELETKILIDN